MNETATMSTETNSGVIRAAFYGRYSSNMQRQASITDQLRACEEYASENRMIILEDHRYIDEAKSGTKERNRTGFEALKAAMHHKPRPFDYILFDDTSRCARDLLDTLAFVDFARKRKINVRYVKQQLDSATPVSACA